MNFSRFQTHYIIVGGFAILDQFHIVIHKECKTFDDVRNQGTTCIQLASYHSIYALYTKGSKVLKY